MIAFINIYKVIEKVKKTIAYSCMTHREHRIERTEKMQNEMQ